MTVCLLPGFHTTKKQVKEEAEKEKWVEKEEESKS